ncbi:hypothetical protein F5Y16DRAFT_374499 [Xylariaceae sp. FL0255]|nr:hypothetical protein F5Y16DRAFT_374499 [Xylariaceae sp. FL0255]
MSNEACNCTSDGTPIYSGALLWFSSNGIDKYGHNEQGPSGWRLDVVTLLAVIGESSIADQVQTITASVLCLLPRIIPAPQALLKPSRPQRLPETTARMVGVHSGVVLDSVGFFANIIHPLDELPAFSFKVLEIKHRDRNNAGGFEVRQSVATNGNTGFLNKLRRSNTRPNRTNTSLSQARSIRGPPPDAFDPEEGPEEGPDGERARKERPGGVEFADPDDDAPKQGIARRPTMKEKMQDFVANPTLANMAARPAIPAKLYSPIHILEVFSAVLTFSIIAYAVTQKDGTAVIAVFLVSMASSISGFASWWRPILMNRSHTNKVPAGDVLIRTREGAFLLVKCTEEVARELYSGTEECEYRVTGQAYRVLMGLGTFVLMVAVVLLGNCKWNTQIFIGAGYVVLNAAYWALSLLPRHLFWDLSRYDWRDVTPAEALNADKTTDPNDPREGVKSFTRTLWYAIRETRKVAWIKRSGAAPNTPQWNLWLAEAENAANSETKNWPAVARKDEIMKMAEDDFKSPIPPATTDFDAAEQAVPAVEVQHEKQMRQTGGF